MKKQGITLKEVKELKKEFKSYTNGGSNLWISVMKCLGDISDMTNYGQTVEGRVVESWDYNDDKCVQEVINRSFDETDIAEIKRILN